jgi:potassium-dependent mechanosensitive channel
MAWLPVGLIVCLAALAPAQEPPTAIPVSEINARAAEVTALLANLDALSASGPDIQAIQQALPEMSKQIQAQLDQLARRLTSDPSAPVLDRLAFVWQRTRDSLGEWADTLSKRGASLQQEVQRLSEMQEAWNRSLQEVQAAKAPPEVVAQVTGTLNALRSARTRVNARLSEALVLEYRVSLELRRTDQALNRVGKAKTDLVDRLRVRNGEPLWTPSLWLRAGSETGAALRNVWVNWGEGLAAEATTQAGRMAWHVAGFLLLYAALRRLRSQLGSRVGPDQHLATGIHILERPVSAALTLALLVAPWVYPSYSLTLSSTARLLAVVPAIRFFSRFIPPRSVRGLYAFGIILMVEPFRPLLPSAPDFEHVVFLVDMCAAGLLVTWIWLAARRDAPGRAAGEYDPPGRSLVPLLGAAYLLAFLAGSFGYLQLARLLATAASRGAYAWLAIHVAVWLCQVLVVWLVRVGPLSVLGSVQRHQVALETRTGRALTWVGFLAWLLVAVSGFAISYGPGQIARGVLEAGLGYGALRVTIGDVLLFGLTIWLAFAISAMVRVTLEADVFPRVRLAEGVPLALANLAHYTILVIGFSLALSILGVDLTKITILVGAFGVGVGFGLQTIINNFMSGLILLFERPIRVGDVVQIGDVRGQVLRIGARAAMVRTGQGAEVFVPNAQLVADKVTNWTYLDRKLRLDLKVTAATGSDPGLVRQLLIETAARHPDLLREPGPAILSLGLGSAGSTLELRVWTAAAERADAIRSELVEALSAALSQAKVNHITGAG